MGDAFSSRGVLEIGIGKHVKENLGIMAGGGGLKWAARNSKMNECPKLKDLYSIKRLFRADQSL